MILCGCTYDEYQMPKNAFININDKTYEVYDKKAKTYDLIDDNNVEILSDNKDHTRWQSSRMGRDKPVFDEIRALSSCPQG